MRFWLLFGVVVCLGALAIGQDTGMDYDGESDYLDTDLGKKEPVDQASAGESATDDNPMRPPPIAAGGLTALLAGALLLLIFLIGFNALFSIQTPQKFDVPDKDIKSKMQ
mmetsp:Transcript_10400/g.43240  ORF Transcript_10400/g.43240 Transcript_10400/m.43240 type:complete len:110 (-) Transcript_10400:622-951(-)|eukprot:CAMPEP_0113954522 /NCGR_PEP_ID=MMETSP0011_2-20120614/616_1 /TAXON_ID=101924 /ORGANISM="Rhodosorus marinus" /LENGTH=109 /DNA_ID=CAMNT_0000963693 /DNA_START=86 /DNA_END=415 /DNA_ORIENTATION=- /assembly_acc=CAM_ASM_000156